MPTYKESLFSIFSSLLVDIENAKYRIKSFLRDGVYGYDKINKKYITIWFPDLDGFRSVGELKFISEYEILMNNELIVDLKNKRIKSL